MPLRFLVLLCLALAPLLISSPFAFRRAAAPCRCSAAQDPAVAPLLISSHLRFFAPPRLSVAYPRYSMHFHCRASHCVTLPLHFLASRYIALAARFISAPLLRNATPRNALPPPIFALLYFAFELIAILCLRLSTLCSTTPLPLSALLCRCRASHSSSMLYRCNS